MLKDDIIVYLNAILEEDFEIEPELLVPAARMGEDLELDSLDAVDLIVAIEKRFGFRMDEEEARKMETLEDIYDAIASELNA